MTLSVDILSLLSGHVIPPDLAPRFAPAACCLQEWQDYWLDLPGVDGLRLNDLPIHRVAGSIFRLRFENQLGLTRLQAFSGGRPLGEAVQVEVISPKFPTPQAHLKFFETLLDDLFARAVRLPFTLNTPTARNVVEARRPPTPLFLYHFLCQEAQRFHQSLAMIEFAPHRLLTEQDELVPLGQVTAVDADTIADILHHPERLQQTIGLPVASRLMGYAPSQVRQILSEETLDTPENRFVLHFLQQVLVAAGKLPRQLWWPNAPTKRARQVEQTVGVIQQAVVYLTVAGVGAMQQIPSQSRVMQRREGYRDLFELWLRFQTARRPLFAPLQQAIEVRDIAALYELWVFFALVDEIGSVLGDAPVIDLHPSDENGVAWGSSARFGRIGELRYNQSFRRTSTLYHSYSLGLRPDFIWMRGGQPQVVFDAKFRMRLDLPTALDEGENQGTPVLDDLYKMHTYRDALGIQAAVSVYPGKQTIFFDRFTGRITSLSLSDILAGKLTGIGAWPMQPGR
jgi:predicted component of viral defense system (DUF524 family)